MIILHQTPPCQLQPIYFRCVLFSSHLQFLLPFMNDDKYCDFFFHCWYFNKSVEFGKSTNYNHLFPWNYQLVRDYKRLQRISFFFNESTPALFVNLNTPFDNLCKALVNIQRLPAQPFLFFRIVNPPITKH